MLNFILTPYAIAQLVTATVSIIVAIRLWQRRSTRGGMALFLFFIAVSEWALGNGLESGAISQEEKILLSKIVYIGAQSSPVLLLLFTLEFSGTIKRIKPSLILALSIVPLTIIFLAATNEAHHLIWTDFATGPAGSNSLIYHHGIAFWAGMVYIFILVSIATVVLLTSSVKTQKIYRFQNMTLLLASLMPWLGTIFYFINPNPFPGLETISISFMFTGLFLMLGFAKGNLMDYIPIALEVLFDNIEAGVVVFDENLRIIDMNPGAVKLFKMEFGQLSGKSPKDQPAFWDKICSFFNQETSCRFEIVSPFDEKTWLSVNTSPLHKKRGRFLGWVVIVEDITSRKLSEEELKNINQKLGLQLDDISKLEIQLRDQIKRDPLTGVYNRGYFEDVLKQELLIAEKKNCSLCVIMLDVDDFKKVNDSFGHKAGDEVVIALGKMLVNRTRDNDYVSRYGGDEFALIMPGIEIEKAFQRAENLRQELSALKFSFSDQYQPITISIGLSSFPNHGKTNDELFSAADSALYHAKQSGKNCTFVSPV